MSTSEYQYNVFSAPALVLSVARAEWLAKRQADLLQCEYFHVVFTLPEQLTALALQNKRQNEARLKSMESKTMAETPPSCAFQ